MTQQPPEAATDTPTIADPILKEIEDVEFYSPTIPLPYQQYHRHIRALAERFLHTQKQLAQAQAELAAAKAGWMPIDSAPRDGTRVLCSGMAGTQFVVRFIANMWRDDGNYYRDPKFWQPLPPPPTSPAQ